MPRRMVGLLAAVAAALAVLASLVHGYNLWVMAAVIAVAAGLVGYASAPNPPVLTASDPLVLTAPDLLAAAEKNP